MTDPYPAEGAQVAALGHIAWLVPELRTVLGRSVLTNNFEFLTYVVVEDFGVYVKQNPDLLPSYLAALEHVLDDHAGHEREIDAQDRQSSLWSLINAGLSAIVDPFEPGDVERVEHLLGPCLTRIIKDIRDWRPGASSG